MRFPQADGGIDWDHLEPLFFELPSNLDDLVLFGPS
jgi:hypothetical protein